MKSPASMGNGHLSLRTLIFVIVFVILTTVAVTVLFVHLLSGFHWQDVARLTIYSTPESTPFSSVGFAHTNDQRSPKGRDGGGWGLPSP